MKIRNVSQTEKQIVREIAKVHMTTFPNFFLTFMGEGFLRQLYSGYCSHQESGLLVAEDGNGNVLGFLAYSANMSDFYRELLRKRLIPFAWYSFLAFLRKPSIFLRLLRAFLKPGESRRDNAYVELASIGVRPDCKKGGIGSQLIDELKKCTDFRKFAYITLETDAENNDAANRFYQKNGFELVRGYETPEGRKMNEYRYHGKDLKI